MAKQTAFELVTFEGWRELASALGVCTAVLRAQATYLPSKMISQKSRDGASVGLGHEAVRRHEVGYHALLPALDLLNVSKVRF